MTWQGWSNKETWDVHLWLNEDPYLMESIVEQIEGDENELEVLDIIEATVTGYIYDLAFGEDRNDPGNLATQLLHTAMSAIEWRAIALNRYEDIMEAAASNN